MIKPDHPLAVAVEHKKPVAVRQQGMRLHQPDQHDPPIRPLK